MRVAFWILLLVVGCKSVDNGEEVVVPQFLQFDIQTNEVRQIIRNFGASDAWSCQFVGKNWPESKRRGISELLFSKELDASGSPKGIGLSAWRFNIGAGSAEQGASSNISDEWRRTEGFLNDDESFDWSKQEGQRWFLNEANRYKVEDLIAFVNSPPVEYTKNGKAYSGGGYSTNLASSNYEKYVDYLATILEHLELNEGVSINYISPFNEPQWDWSDGSQEGSPWANNEVQTITSLLNDGLIQKSLSSKIELPETAEISYLYQKGDKPYRGDQINAFFNASSTSYVGALDHVAHKVAAHSYYSTWDHDYFLFSRQNVDMKRMAVDPTLEYWMTEYCPLENNSEIEGNGRDLGMNTALYCARVIHADLTVANASAWQWWLAVSPYDYKDGLVYIDYNKEDGSYYDSKTLWALGNYARFVRPGMSRVEVSRSDNKTIAQSLGGVMASSYINSDQKTVTVIVNYGQSEIPMKLTKGGNALSAKWYLTSTLQGNNLAFKGEINFADTLMLPARSVSTFVE